MPERGVFFKNMSIDRLEAMIPGNEGKSCAIVRRPDGKLLVFECEDMVRTGEKIAMLIEKKGEGNRKSIPRLVRFKDPEAADFLAKLPLPGEIQPVASSPDVSHHLSDVEEVLRIARETGRGIIVKINSF